MLQLTTLAAPAAQPATAAVGPCILGQPYTCAALPSACSRYVTAVNKRLRRLFFEQPSLWCSLQLPTLTTSEQLEAKLALLRRVAPLLSAFTVEPNSWQGSEWNLDGSSGHLPLTAFLQLLPPSLTALALGTRADPLELPPATVQLLRPFTALRSLSLHCLMEAGALPAALQHMPHLEQLDCRVQRSPDLQPLTQLSQLRRLQLRDCGGSVDSGLRPPVLAALPQLEHFEVESFSQELVEVRAATCVAGCAWRSGGRSVGMHRTASDAGGAGSSAQQAAAVVHTCAASRASRQPHSAASKHRLHIMQQCRGHRAVPATQTCPLPLRLQVADTRCAGCYMRPSLFGNDDSADQQAVMSLHIRNARPLGSLQSLLSAVVRPNLTLQALELEQVSVSAEALEGCTQLTALKRLRLCSCVCDAAAAAALFAASRHLTSLDLVCWDGPAFAALNLQLPPQLKRLCIVDYGFCLPLELEQVSGLEILVRTACGGARAA